MPIIFLIFIFFTVPYLMFSSAMEHAASSPKIRKSLKKDILVSTLPVIYAFASDKSVLVIGAWESMAKSISLFGGNALSLIAFPAISFFSIQAIRIGFFNQSPPFSARQFIVFIIIFYTLFLYSMNNTEIMILSYQFPIVLMFIIGILYFVFLGACHTIFAKFISLMNISGFAISIINENSLYSEKYFLLLQLLPKFPEKVGFIIVAVSTLVSAYNYCVERDWLPPLPI